MIEIEAENVNFRAYHSSLFASTGRSKFKSHLHSPKRLIE